MASSVEKNEKTILKKHINTIHCSNNLTLVQRKLFNALLFYAYHDLPEKSIYHLSVKKLCELIGYDSRDYKKLRQSILSLMTTAIEWNVIDKENGEQQDKWRASAIISAAKIEKGICTYEFSTVMRELLHSPEIYGKIDIKLMIAFKSSYGLALYENCIRFYGISQTQWLSIHVFRKLMGIPDGSYQSFCDFKKRVLDIAIKEVNQYSPIIVQPEVMRVNKKVTSIRFKLTHKTINPNIETPAVASKVLDIDLINTLKSEFGLSPEMITDLSLKYGNLYIKNKVFLIKASDSFRKGKIRELSAYLIDALKRDYQTGKVISMPKRERDAPIQQKVLTHEKDVVENEKKRERISHYLNGLNEAEKNGLMLHFENYLFEKDSFYSYKKYKEVGTKSPAIQAMLNTFIDELINE